MQTRLTKSTQNRIVALIIIIIVSFLAGQIILNKSERDRFDKVIHERAAEKKGIFMQADSVLGKNLSTFAYDYSLWDDMLQFVNHPSKSWAHTNIEVSLETFKCQAAWVYKPDFSLVYSYSLIKEASITELPVDKSLFFRKVEQNPFLNFFVMVNGKVMEIQCAPIQTGTDAGRKTVPGGYLFIGKVWDSYYLNALQKLTASSSLNFRSIKSGIPVEDNLIAEDLTVVYRRTLRGWDGTPVATIESVTEFPMMNEFLKSLNLKFLQTILFTAALLITVTFYLLIRVGIPLRRISASVESGDPDIIDNLRLSDNEFGKLANLITEFFRQKETLIKEIEDRKKTQSELQNKVTRLQLIKALHNAFIGTLDIRQIFQRVYELIPFYLGPQGIQSAKLLMYNAAEKKLESGISTGAAGNGASDPDQVDAEVCTRCFSSGLPVIINDCRNSELISKEYISLYGLRSVIALPVVSNQRIIGVIRLDNITNNNGFSFSDIELFSMIAEQLGIVIHNSQLFSEQKNIEEALRTSEEKYRTIFENTGTASLIVEEDTTVTLVNAEWVRLSGYSREEIEGKVKWADYVDPEDLPRLLDYHNKRRNNASDSVPNRYELKMRTKTGEVKDLILTISIIPGSKKSIVSMYDITERKMIEMELKDSRARAEYSDRVKSEFLAQMSHEIRTPINIILSYTSLIGEALEVSADNELKDCFTSIRLAGKRIIRTIDLLLNMSEVQTGSYEKIPKQLNLHTDVLDPVYTEFLHPANDKGLVLELIKGNGNFIFTADEYSVCQIFVNLVENAIKYTSRGKICINSYLNDEGCLTVEVSDTGIGINKDFLPNIFRPFSQEEQGYSRKFEGNGLGLALVRHYCEINNASIEVESEKDKGTTFRVVFQPETN